MTFDEASHTYEHKGHRYTSVSEWLGTTEKPFPKEQVAAYTAKKDGRTAAEVIAEWDLNAAISCNYGTSVHQAIEMWLRYGKVTKIHHLSKVVNVFAQRNITRKIIPEVIAYSEEYRLAGTIDQLVILGPKTVWVQDVKTNAEMKPEKIEKYRKQLSAYKFLLECRGIAVKGLNLEWWDGKKFKTIDLEPIDLTEQIKQLQHYG